MRLQTSTIVTVGLSVAGLAICAMSASASKPHALRDPFAPPPEPLPKKRTPKEAAAELLAYITPLIAAGDLAGLGTQSNPSNAIANLQRDMGSIASDGIYGPKTAARGKQLLGQAFPARPKPPLTLKAATPAALPSSTSPTVIPTHVVEVGPPTVVEPSSDKPKWGWKPTPIAPATSVVTQGPTPTPPPAPLEARTAKQAAKELLAYVSPRVRAGQLAELGTKEAPSDYIAAAQRDMKLIASDGIYGPKTAARGKELLGIEFPSRTKGKRVAPQGPPLAPIEVMMQPPPAPDTPVAKYSPLEAANALYLLVKTPPVDWGTRAAPNQTIHDAQAAMGGIVADGVYGPKTQARGAKLTGKKFPPRG